MIPPTPLLAAWIVALSVADFALAGWDKARAGTGGRRVPERVLLGLALVGGSPGLLAAMLAFRHKTKKPSFLLGFALVVAAQVAVVAYAMRA